MADDESTREEPAQGEGQDEDAAEEPQAKAEEKTEANVKESQDDQGEAKSDDNAEAKSDDNAEAKSDEESEDEDDAAEPGRNPDKPMNDAQRTYLEPLAGEQDEEYDENMSEADAAQKIDDLQENAVHVY